MSEEKTTTPGNSGHRARLRRRFLDHGLGTLHDHEALELLLTFAIPRRDVKVLAKTLIARFGSFERVFDATEYELSAVPGVGENAAALVLLCKGICAKYLEQKVKEEPVELASPEAVVNFIRMKIGGNPKESMMVIFLNARKFLLGYHILPGTVDRTVVYRREILERCFQYKATAVILAHNHPSGICEPSPEDISLTRKIHAALASTDIELVDHLIVSPALYRSMRHERFF